MQWSPDVEWTTKAAWLLLAAIHISPALVFLKPNLVEALYGVSPSGAVGALLTHRGALFLAVVVIALWAAFDSGTRKLPATVITISVVGFLFVYLRAGMPTGPLRTIALVDLAALAPLAWVGWVAFAR